MKQKILSLLLIISIISCETLEKRTIRSKIKPIQQQNVLNAAITVKNIVVDDNFIQDTKRLLDKLKKRKLEGIWKSKELEDLINRMYSMDNYLGRSEKVVVAPFSNTSVNLTPYCLDSNKPSPDRKDSFHWVRGQPKGIRNYKNIMKVEPGKNLGKEDIQEAIWNIEKGVKLESYSRKGLAVLKKVDPYYLVTTDSEIRGKAIDYIIDEASKRSSAIDSVISKKEEFENKYRDYNSYKKQIEGLVREDLGFGKDPNEYLHIPNTQLFAHAKMNGYSSSEINIYNPTEKTQSFEIGEYYLEPRDSNVQRVGVGTPINQIRRKKVKSLLLQSSDFVQKLLVGLTPGLNDVADVTEFVIGRDVVTGENLEGIDRVLSGLGIIIGSGQLYRGLRAAGMIQKHKGIDSIYDFNKKFIKASVSQLENYNAILDAVSAYDPSIQEFRGNRLKKGPLTEEEKKGYRLILEANKKWLF